eukprot:6489202-Amphidinium_carterae.1
MLTGFVVSSLQQSSLLCDIHQEQQSSLAMMQALAEPTAQQNEQERAARMASEPHFAALVQAKSQHACLHGVFVQSTHESAMGMLLSYNWKI